MICLKKALLHHHVYSVKSLEKDLLKIDCEILPQTEKKRKPQHAE